MSTQELQLSLISQILQTVDENVLKLLHETLQKTLSKSKSKTKKKLSIHDPKHPYYAKLTPEEEKGVGEALAEHKAGKGVILSTIEEMQNYFYNLS